MLTSLTLKVWGQIYDYFPKPPNISGSYCIIKLHLSLSLQTSAIYSYWFFLLNRSVSSKSFLKFSTLSGFIFPAFKAFLLAFSQFKWSCSSIRCRDGFRLFVSINVITSLYLVIHFSSCVMYSFPLALSLFSMVLRRVSITYPVPFPFCVPS